MPLLEDSEEVLDAVIESDREEPTFVFKKPSIWLIFKTVLKLIPVIVYLRKDRREWVKQVQKARGKGIKDFCHPWTIVHKTWTMVILKGRSSTPTISGCIGKTSR